MKIILAPISVLLAIPMASTAAPRLVVSTPSLSPESKIDLVLDLPVVATTELGKTVDNTWLEISPAIPGKLRWKAQNIAEFLPDQPPVIGATYQFSIPKERKHLDQSAVPPGKITTLDAEPFAVKTANSGPTWSEDYSPSTASWLIVFNDAVDPAKIGSFITFTSNSGQQVAARLERATAGRLGYQADSYKPWAARFKTAQPQDPAVKPAPETEIPIAIVATPLSPLPPGGAWKISVLKGLPNADAKARVTADTTYSIGDIKPFAVDFANAVASADAPRRIVIGFNAKLPKDLPPGFLENSLQITPLPEKLAAETDGRTLTLTGDFSPGDTWTVSVRPPLASGSGLPLALGFTKEVKFEIIQPELILPSENQGQLAGGTRSYRVHTVNLSSIHVRVKKLAGNDLVRAMQGYRHYTGYGPDNTNVSPTAPLPYSLVTGQTIYDKEIPLDNPVDTSKEITLHWDEILPKELRAAGLFLDITGTPNPGLTEEPKKTNSQAIVQLTDIGLAWKLTPKEAFIYAFSCATGQPLRGVALDLFGEDAAPLGTVTTDASGLATLPRGKDARHLRASLGADTYITAFDSTLATVGLWHFPIRYSWSAPREQYRRAFLFTDRSLYRPGETVRLKGMVRTQKGNAIEPAEPAPARIVIVDPTDKEILNQPVTISEAGSFDLTFKLQDEITGPHMIKLEFPEDLEKAEALEDNWQEQEALVASGRFVVDLNVEEFRRNAFEVTQTIPEPAIGTAAVEAKLSARYYQGQPVAAGKASHYTRVSEKNLYPDRFQDFLFGNHRQDDRGYWFHYFRYRWDDGDGALSTPEQTQGETQLSAEGDATIAITLPKTDFPAAREVTIATEVTDANNQTLTATSTTTVHPASVYIGISRNDRLVRVGEALPLKLVAVQPDGEPYGQPLKLQATITREVNNAVKSLNAEGEAVTRNDVTEETALTSEITLDPAASAKEGQVFQFLPKSNGRHYLTIRGTDPEGRPFATVTSFTVYGSNEYPWQYEEGLRVKLVAEKKSYKPGETARVLVLSPIEGTALVTVEREKVLRSFLVPLKADKPLIEIPLTEEDAPNAYVSVLIVKGAGDSAREFKAPQMRLGYCELIVENLRDKLAVNLDATAPSGDTVTISTGGKSQEFPSYRPGEEVTITGTVLGTDGKPAGGSEVTLYVEDEGTLAVMGYETPAPLDFFYDPRILGIEVGTSFDSFLSENPDEQYFYNKGFFIGGGADLGKLADLLRKNFDPCATWAPALVTDANGKFTHTFKLPDTLTRYRIVAVASQGGSKFGHAESALVASKPLMLEPKAPRFVNQGDTFSPQVLVQNASRFAGTWQVSVKSGEGPGTPSVRLTGEPTATVTLQPGGSSTLVFPAIAESTGEAVFTWTVTPVSLAQGQLNAPRTRSLSDAVETRFPVQYPMPLLKQTKFVKLEDPGKPRNLLELLDKQLLDGEGDLDIEFSRSPLAEAAGSVDYLLSYPYGCVEQTTSSLMPWFAVESLRPVIPSFSKYAPEKVRAAIQHGADRLLSMQLKDGSFSYWPGATDRVNWATAYAGLGLILAEKNGAVIPPAAIDALSKSLIGDLRGISDLKSPYELEIHSRALWILALAGQPQPAYHSVMRDRLADLNVSARAYLAMAIHASGDKDGARAILTSKVPFKAKDDQWMRWNASQPATLLAWASIAPNAPETTSALDRLFRDRNPYGHWNTTWVNGWSLLAIAEYAKTEKDRPETIQLAVQTATGTQNIELAKDRPTATVRLKVRPDLRATVTGKGMAFARLSLAAKPRIEPIQPVATNGLSVDRIYERVKADGTAEILTEPSVGDLIRVSLRLTLPTDDNRYLVIEDLLPSIFETVNNDFASQKAAVGISTSETNWRVSHSELRDDRAVFFVDQFWKRGTYTLTYLARCTVAGEAMAPPAKAEAMYDPEKFALSASRKFVTK